MSILRIYALSESTWWLKDVSLRQPTRELSLEEIKGDWLKGVIIDMFETLYSTPSGVGLSATQVGLQIKLIVIDIRRDAKKPVVLINPTYTPLTDEMNDSNESCLSVPGVVGTVKRYTKIKVDYQDIHGRKVTREATGFESNVLQHEIDHLNGILYVDKMQDGESVRKDVGHVNRVACRAVNKLYEVTP